MADIEVQADLRTNKLVTSSGSVINSRIVTVAAGAAAGKFLKYEEGAPTVSQSVVKQTL